MKRALLFVLLVSAAGVARGDGLLKALVCWRPFGGPYYGCHGGCDAGCMSGPNGCGARYWGDFWDPPPECCDPCDGTGNWIGPQACYPPRPLLNLFYGLHHYPGAYGGCGGCGTCDDCCSSGYVDGGYYEDGYSSGYSQGDYVEGQPGCTSCGQGGGAYYGEPASPTPARGAPAPTQNAPVELPPAASSGWAPPRMPPSYHSAARRPSPTSRPRTATTRPAPATRPAPSVRTRSEYAPVQYQAPPRSATTRPRASSPRR